MTALAVSIHLAFAGAIPATAQSATEPEKPKAAAADHGRRTVRRLPANLGRGILGVFYRDSVIPFVIGGVATGGASVLDQEFRARINPDPNRGWGKAIGTASGPVWGGVFVASLFATGRISGNERFRAASYDVVDAAAVNVVYFQSLKLIVQRQRPNGTNHQSFPSGHTSNAFALATVAERHYGWKVGVPAYVIAGAVGAARMKQDMHYFSDVIAGATLGYIVGRTVVRVNSKPIAGASGGAVFSMSPIVARAARGLQVSVNF